MDPADNSRPKRGTTERLRALAPDIWQMVRPRRGLLALGFVLMAISRVCGLVLPASTRYLVDNVIGKRETWLLRPLILAVVGATAVQGLTSFALTQLLSKAAQRLIAELRQKVQSHIGRLPVSYYDSNKTGTLVSRIMNDVEGIRNLIGTGMVDFIGGLLTAVIALVVLVRISWPMTLVAVGVIGAFALALRRAFKVIRPIFKERAKITADVTGRLNESLGGVRVVKAYRAEPAEREVFAGGVRRLLDNVLRTITSVSLMSLGATVLMGVVGALVMYVGTRQIFAGSLTLGGFVTFTMFLAFLVAPVINVVGIGTQLSEALAGLERTREVLAERPEDEDPRRTAELRDLRGHVVFDNVSFAYEPGKPVLNGIGFESQPGTVTALVGSSGAGKSTVSSLIAAFHSPTGGTILVDGVDLATLRLSSYRAHLGAVLQESFLFDGTIRENVAFSRPGASQEEILAACRIARVDEFAEKLEKSYDTLVGERGVKLSGGQRQRVSIARAILADPRILILDEATSSLDSESEALIQEGLGWLMKGRTTFVIAHRLSTIRRADQILVIEAGRILERGTHASLFEARGRYYDLYTRQHGLEANLFLAPGDVQEPAEGDGATVVRRPAAGLRLPDVLRPDQLV